MIRTFRSVDALRKLVDYIWVGNRVVALRAASIDFIPIRLRQGERYFSSHTYRLSTCSRARAAFAARCAFL